MKKYTEEKKVIMDTKMRLFYQFTAGFLSVFWLAKPAIRPPKKTGGEEDAKNLQSDWINVGKDIRRSYEQFEAEHP